MYNPVYVEFGCLCVCMYVCVYIYIHTHAHIHTCTHTQTQTHTHTHIHTHLHTRIYRFIYMLVCIVQKARTRYVCMSCVYVCVHVYVCVNMYPIILKVKIHGCCTHMHVHRYWLTHFWKHFEYHTSFHPEYTTRTCMRSDHGQERQFPLRNSSCGAC